jgi:hypothetical protein
MVEADAFAGCTGKLLRAMHTKTAQRSRDRMKEENLSGSLTERLGDFSDETKRNADKLPKTH